MPHAWLIKTLEDLCRYARMNQLTELSFHLEQAVLLARIEVENTAPAQEDAPHS
ncbi:hypothetical protein [Pararhodobacter marinus]|uniref:hypothetical protein n=1 Tax=Pararhodobacter marinus TaxID=2184063 RepID=UPI00143CD320|nr:hypothetical protein [Pararhodobacter marinus]